jgi:hypothetical protein
MHEYKVTFSRERDSLALETATIIVDSLIVPESLILDVHVDYSYGDYEYVQERLAELEELARKDYDFIALHDFTSVTCPDGTVVEPT